jgi:hypothetical protein
LRDTQCNRLIFRFPGAVVSRHLSRTPDAHKARREGSYYCSYSYIYLVIQRAEWIALASARKVSTIKRATATFGNGKRGLVSVNSNSHRVYGTL